MKLENVVQSACMYTTLHHWVEPGYEVALGGWVKNSLLGHPRKHPYHPHGGNRKLTAYPFLDVLIHLLLSETIFMYGSFRERPIIIIIHAISCNRKFVEKKLVLKIKKYLLPMPGGLQGGGGGQAHWGMHPT